MHHNTDVQNGISGGEIDPHCGGLAQSACSTNDDWHMAIVDNAAACGPAQNLEVCGCFVYDKPTRLANKSARPDFISSRFRLHTAP